MDATTQPKSDELIELERKIAAAQTNSAEQRRLERLKHRHEKALLGPLAKAVHKYSFRDGVLHSATLLDGKKLGECAMDPRWASVGVLDLRFGSTFSRLGMSISEFIATLPLLHTLSLQPEHLPDRPFAGVCSLQVDSEVSIGVIAELFPQLEELELSCVRRPEELWAHPFTEHLDSLTLGSLTWKRDVLLCRPGESSASAEWIAKGPPLRRLEIQEEAVFGAYDSGELQELFDAARSRGADVVMLPEPMPRSEWSPWRRRDRYDRWH